MTQTQYDVAIIASAHDEFRELNINKLTKNLNITLLEFYESVKNNENYILGMIAYDQMDFKSASIFLPTKSWWYLIPQL